MVKAYLKYVEQLSMLSYCTNTVPGLQTMSLEGNTYFLTASIDTLFLISARTLEIKMQINYPTTEGTLKTITAV